MYTLTTTQFNFVQSARPFLPTQPTDMFEFSLLNTIACKAGYSIVPAWIMSEDRKQGRGFYSVPELFASDTDITVIPNTRNRNKVSTPAIITTTTTETITPMKPTTTNSTTTTTTTTASLIKTASQTDIGNTFIPLEDDNYIPWGYHNEIKKIVKSGSFCPIFITGLSGNGKTTMVEQVCAQLNRECIRVNLTAQTDEDELIGGFRLQNGETVFCPGPALVAMQRGAVLLLDEVDLGTHLIMCLQSILEGKGKFIPKIGMFVRPVAGFTVVATANTKGKGCSDGRFIGTNQMNEAFLERFRFTYEQDYAGIATENKILTKYAESVGVDDSAFIVNLVNWADIIRKSFKQNVVSDIITTRRLRDIVFGFSIFGDKMTAIERCVSRFDEDTKNSFMEFYTKVDADTQMKPPEVSPAPASVAVPSSVSSTVCPI